MSDEFDHVPEVREDPARGAMGMTRAQQALIRTAVEKFQATTFTVGMLCEVSGAAPDDCISELQELHAMGVVRCPVNDGGCMLYEVIPELVRRATVAR